MPNERIRITGSEFRATSATEKITFSTNNQYLKTDTAGILNAGGYDRVPIIAGREPFVDNIQAGGFFTSNYEYWIGLGGTGNVWGAAGTTMSYKVPFYNANMTIAMPWVEQDYYYGYKAYEYRTSIQGTIYSESNEPVEYTVDGVVAGTYRLARYSSMYPGANIGFIPRNLSGPVVPGVYSFGPLEYLINKPFRVLNYQTGQPTGEIVYNTTGGHWKTLSIYFTQPTTQLSLAVTP